MVLPHLMLGILLVVAAGLTATVPAEGRFAHEVDDMNQYSATGWLERQCARPALGDAAPFNVVVFGDVIQDGTATTGRMAVGGNATLTNYSIGSHIPTDSADSDTLVVQGTLRFLGGSVASGNVATGGPATLQNLSFASGFGHRSAVPVDFEAMEAHLRLLSRIYALMPVNGESTVRYGRIALTGADPVRNVFEVSEDALAGANTLSISAPAGSEVIVNITGDAATLTRIGLELTGVRGNQVLINASEATKLSLSGIGVTATILAPSADIVFEDGSIQGTVIGASLEGSGNVSPLPFTGCSPVPQLSPSMIRDLFFANYLWR